VSRHDYLPFGEELYAGVGGRTTGLGYTASDNVRQKFTAKERDTETGLDYFLARYYASQQGRFASIDPSLASGRAHLPQSWNRYVYVLNNPLLFIDPDGRKEKPFDPRTDKPVDWEKAKKGSTPVIKQDPQTGKDMIDPKSGKAIGNEKAYNCHSYTWHDKKGDPSDPRNAQLVAGGVTKWDQSPADDLEGQRQMGSDEPNKKGDKVLYYVDANSDGLYTDGERIEHSAKVTKVDKEGNTILVKSKLGQAGEYENHPGAPTYYEKTRDQQEIRRAYFRENKKNK
jgi:RHS repeat-associated protein